MGAGRCGTWLAVALASALVAARICDAASAAAVPAAAADGRIDFKPGASGPRGSGVIGNLEGEYNMAGQVVRLAPCVMRTVHTHASDELIYMLQGSITSGLVQDGKLTTQTLSYGLPGAMAAYPATYPHFQANLGSACKTAIYVASFNAPAAGVKTVNLNATNLPAGLGEPWTAIMTKGWVNATFADAAAPGVTIEPSCAARCYGKAGVLAGAVAGALGRR